MSPSDGSNILFIAGCPRSGTTYLQRLLAALPKIQTGQETHLFQYIWPVWMNWQRQKEMNKKDGRGGVGLPCYFEEDEFMDHLHQFIHKLLAPMVTPLKDGELFVEKTPSNALYIDAIYATLPKAKIICIQRDARDVVASLLAVYRSWGRIWAPDNAKAAAEYWCRHVEKSVADAKKLPGSQILHIKYEDLQARTVDVLSKMLPFLGLHWSIEDLEKAVNDNRLDIAQRSGGTQIRKNTASSGEGDVVQEPKGFVRRGRPGGWAKDLTLKEKIWVWRIARATMKREGYDWKFPWYK